MSVRPHSKPDEIGRPGKILKTGVGGIAGQPIVCRGLARQRNDPGAQRKEGTRHFANVRKGAVDGDEAIVGWNDGHFFPCEFLFGELAIDERTGFPSRDRNQRCIAGIDRTLDNERDVASHCIGELINRVIVPPFSFDHRIPSSLSRSSLRVSEPSCNCLSRTIECRAEFETGVRKGADLRINRGKSASVVDRALADQTMFVDP